jgi:Rhodopirellula transposase DDE domain
MGRQRYPHARESTTTVDCGASTGARVRLRKVELQKLADETEISLQATVQSDSILAKALVDRHAGLIAMQDLETLGQ